MPRRILAALAVASFVALMLGVSVPPASAHEGRRVGTFQLDAGWGTEPAYAGFLNSVQLHLEEAHPATAHSHGPGTAEDHAVTDLKDTLKVEVSFGAKKQTYTMAPAFVVGVSGEPGDYRAYLIPTEPGTYSFRFFGTIRGQPVNTRFTSGPTTFDDVHNTAEAGFPDKDPSLGELSTKVDRETARLTAAMAAVVEKAKQDADNAKLFGYAGLGLAAVATVIALARGRKTSA